MKQIIFLFLYCFSFNAFSQVQTEPKSSSEFKNLNFKTFYFQNLRRIKDSESIPPGNVCGYCSESYSVNAGDYYSSGLGIGVNYTENRMHLSLEISLETYKIDFNSNYRLSESHPHLPWGTIEDYSSKSDFISGSFHRLRIDAGVGINILHPQKKIKIVPSIKLAQGYVVHEKIETNYTIMKRVYDWNGNPNPNGNYTWDSIIYPSNFSLNKFTLDLLVGCSITAQVFQNFQINCDFYYGLGSTPMISNSKNPFMDRLRFYRSIGLGYRIPLKNKNKPII